MHPPSLYCRGQSSSGELALPNAARISSGPTHALEAAVAPASRPSHCRSASWRNYNIEPLCVPTGRLRMENAKKPTAPMSIPQQYHARGPGCRWQPDAGPPALVLADEQQSLLPTMAQSKASVPWRRPYFAEHERKPPVTLGLKNRRIFLARIKQPVGF